MTDTLVPKLCLGTQGSKLCFAVVGSYAASEAELRELHSQAELGNEWQELEGGP